jgi:hypothetical protein
MTFVKIISKVKPMPNPVPNGKESRYEFIDRFVRYLKYIGRDETVAIANAKAVWDDWYKHHRND